MSSSMGSGGMPIPDARIVTADGEELGEVKETAADRFKVDASLQSDYWLSNASIAATTTNGIRLSITKDQLGDAIIDGP